MKQATRQRLLDLNRDFYATIASDFDATRQGWTPGLLRVLAYLPSAPADEPLTVLDAGCGNGRFAHILNDYLGAEKSGPEKTGPEKLPAPSQRAALEQSCAIQCGSPVHYIGIDNDAQLLALARQSTAELVNVQAEFHQADLAQAGWSTVIGVQQRTDLVLCTATMQHLPGYDLRRRVLAELASCTRQRLIISAWQFLSSSRFRQKLIPWARIGLQKEDVEPGDALLPWKQGQFAIRYVHQLDEDELRRLAADVGLAIVDAYRADGKEGNLNLYMVMQR